MKKSLVIINNEKCAKVGDHFFCENIEISSLSKSLLNFFNVCYTHPPKKLCLQFNVTILQFLVFS